MNSKVQHEPSFNSTIFKRTKTLPFLFIIFFDKAIPAETGNPKLINEPVDKFKTNVLYD